MGASSHGAPEGVPSQGEGPTLPRLSPFTGVSRGSVGSIPFILYAIGMIRTQARTQLLQLQQLTRSQGEGSRAPISLAPCKYPPGNTLRYTSPLSVVPMTLRGNAILAHGSP